jgi:hypothetical protein
VPTIHLDTCSSENDTICSQTVQLLFFGDTEYLERCSCPRECISTSYALTTSFSEFPTKYYYKVLTKNEIIKKRFPNNITHDNLRKSIVSINIFFNEIKETVINHDPSMTFSDLISNIGGTLGIFMGIHFKFHNNKKELLFNSKLLKLGMSFLSYIELVEIVLQSLIIYFKK